MVKDKLKKAERIFSFCIAILLVLLFLFRDYENYILPFILVVLTLLSGYIAFLNFKLPKEEREQPRWMASPLSIHPYVTFFTTVIADIVYVVYLIL